MPDKVIVRIERCDGPGHPSYWEEFHVEQRPNANVISVLMQIQRNPVTADGKKTTPPAWDAACLEEVCGSCTMVINGKVRQACSALIDHLTEPITLQPMKKFPLVRDLTVDRQKMFNALKRVKAWIPVDGTYDLGPGPRQAQEDQEINYVLSTCMTCGCCLEVCPQVSPATAFIGAAVQQPPDRKDECRRAVAGADGPRRRRRLRQGGQLCGGLPETDSAHVVD